MILFLLCVFDVLRRASERDPVVGLLQSLRRGSMTVYLGFPRVSVPSFWRADLLDVRLLLCGLPPANSPPGSAALPQLLPGRQ